MHPRRWLLPVAAILLVLAFSTLAPAQPEEADSEQATREVHVDHDADEVTLQLEPTDGEEDAEPVRLDVDPPNGTLALTHGEDQEEPGMELRLDTLVAYRDADGNGTYEVGEPLSSVWTIGGQAPGEAEANGTTAWASPIVTNASLQGADGKRVIVPAQIGEGAGLTLRLLAFGEPVEVGNTSLAPTSIKLDIVLENVPVERNDTDLALLATARTPADDLARGHRLLAEDEEGLVATQRQDGAARSFLFAWQTTALVDGRPTPVEASEIGLPEDVDDAETEEERRRTAENDTGDRAWQRPGAENLTRQRFALAYEHGDRIVHDPRVAVASTEDEAADTPGAGIAGVLGALLAADALRRRR